jgi:lipoprotein-anchoring transpeptidase ErfK/SrfK
VRFYKDWTHGCVSVGDRAIEEIYAAVEIGTPIEIRP